MTAPPALQRLPQLAVIRLDGLDARGFLQGQLTQDIGRLSPEVSVVGAHCTPQGRVLALMRLALADEAVLVVLPRELAATAVERLRKFVLRAKVRIEIPDSASVYGCVASDGSALRAALPSCPVDPDSVTHDGGRIVIRLPGARALLVGPPVSGVEPAGDQLAAWELAAIQQGEPLVCSATAERWVPQMLNLDLVGAVSFTKGCYPGQEIVARTQHLGRIKRRMLRYAAQGRLDLSPGDDLYDGTAKAGEVVRSACVGARTELLAVVGLEHAPAPIVTGAGDTLELQPLPYVVPEAAAR